MQVPTRFQNYLISGFSAQHQWRLGALLKQQEVMKACAEIADMTSSRTATIAIFNPSLASANLKLPELVI